MEAAHTLSRKLTYADLCAMPEDNLRHELIDGVHYVSPSATIGHQRIVGEIFYCLRCHLAEAGTGEVFISPLDVVLSEYDVLEPDVIYLTAEQVSAQTQKHLHGAPALAIEVLSPSSRRMDRERKRRVYERFGVLEYWVVDPDAASVHVYRRGEHDPFPSATELTRQRSDVLTTTLLPGFALDLAALFP